MKNPIQNNQTLGSIESNIISETRGKKLWGDIAVTQEEYECLKSKIRDLLKKDDIDIRDICKYYPCALTTFMVFLVRYQFNVNFWGLMSKELGISIIGSVEAEIGLCARMTFSKYGFDFSDVKGERRVNLEPILYEAGRPPESCLDDLFYILKYDANSVFDPQLIIEDLVEMRSYQIRKPMLRFLKRFRDERAVEFVLEVHDAMLAVDQNMTGESHYIGNYSDWKEKERTKEASARRKKQEFQAKPYLVFENGKRGLCLVLPRTIMKDEWVEDVEWEVIADTSDPIHRRMTVFGDEGKRFVETIVVPVSPAGIYQITLYDCEGVETGKIVDWQIDGIRNGFVAFFNANGRRITPHYLPFPYGIMIFPVSVTILELSHVSLTYQSYPTNREGYSVAAVEPTGRDASFSYLANGSINILNNRPQIDMRFFGKTLFSLETDENYRLFTDLPELRIYVDEGTDVSGFELRLGTEKADINGLFVNGVCTVDLKEYRRKVYSCYGTYGIRLYQNDHFLKQIEFSYVPAIQTTYSPSMRWPKGNERRDHKVFRFDRLKDWELEFPNCVVSSDEEKYIVECPTNAGAIIGILKTTLEDEGFTCRFELPVNPFKVDILASDGSIREEATDRQIRFGLDELKDEAIWVGFECFGRYRNCQYKLMLRTANGIEQEEYISISKNGCGNFNLMAFYDTLNACPLPAQIELWCDAEETTIPVLVVSDTLELKMRPVYIKNGFIVLGIQDENKDLTVKRFGIEQNEIMIPYERSRLSKSQPYRGYPAKLEEGIYVVTGENQKYDCFFEDELGVEITNGKNTMYVSARDKDTLIVSFSDWLDQLIKDIIRAGVNRDITASNSYRMLGSIHELERTELNKYDYERLASLPYFAEAKCVDSKKESVCRCMNEISRQILNGKIRLELIRLMAEISCPKSVFEISQKEYHLLLFERGAKDSKDLAEKLENNSTELAMLLMMGAEESVWDTIRRDKFRDLIGREAIRCLLSVPDEDDPAEIAMEQKRFLREYNPCKVKINLTKEIAGDMAPLAAMVKIEKNSVVFDISKKPDYGIYFDRIRYVDQYVNWYTVNHKKGEMVSWKKDLMKSMVQKECKNILSSFYNLERVGSLGKMMSRYEEVLRNRYKGDPMDNLTVNNYPRFFYLQGLAAFLAMIPAEYRKYGREVRTGERFMIDAMKVAPRIAQRDLVMASTYIYLVGKEGKICR